MGEVIDQRRTQIKTETTAQTAQSTICYRPEQSLISITTLLAASNNRRERDGLYQHAVRRNSSGDGRLEKPLCEALLRKNARVSSILWLHGSGQATDKVCSRNHNLKVALPWLGFRKLDLLIIPVTNFVG
jgi:hypothetical protein